MYEYRAKMVHVVDGDTQDYLVDLGFGISCMIRVRLAGIDTPEIFHPVNAKERMHGQGAKEFVVKTYLNKEGVLRTEKDDTGKYGRYLADFVCAGNSLTTDLLENNFAKREDY